MLEKILLSRFWSIYKYPGAKDITIPLIIHYYLLRAFRTLRKSFRQIITSGFFRVSTGRWHNAIRVRAKPCAVILLMEPPAEVPRQGLGHS